jgi:SAM-dependent methyltransferase
MLLLPVIVPKHIDIIRDRISGNQSIRDIYVLDARDLSVFDDASFDAVLCMGAMYHLKDRNERRKVVSECLRVLKADGLLFSAYINRTSSLSDRIKKRRNPSTRVS